MNTLGKLWEEYQENEDENFHTENVVLITKQFGSEEDITESIKIKEEHERVGYLTQELKNRRDKLNDKYYPMFRTMLKRHGVLK